MILAIAVLGAACVLTVGTDGASLLPAGFATLLLALGAVIALYYVTHNQAKQEAGDKCCQDTCGCTQASIYRYALPTWAAQVEATRTLTEEAIDNLATHFSIMSQRVERAGSAAQSGRAMTGGLALLLGESRQELEAIVVSLGAALATKEALQHEVAELARHTEQLRSMTQHLGNIVEQTRRLAQKAALGGQDLELFTAEIGEFCSLSGETGKRIAETVQAVNAAIEKSLAITGQYVERDWATPNESRQVIEQVIKRFRSATNTLLESASELHEESQAIGKDITQVLVSLQFQRQVSQVLDMVRNDLDKLHLSFVC